MPTKGNLMSSEYTMNREEVEGRAAEEESVAEERVTLGEERTVKEENVVEERVATEEEKAGTEVRTVEEEDKNLKVVYQNVGRSIEATNILLAREREEKWDLVFVAEAWEGRSGERMTQNGYRSFSKPGSKVVLYIWEEVNLRTLGPINISTDWISVNNLITGVYLSPSLCILPLREWLINILIIDVIIGDFNCTQ